MLGNELWGFSARVLAASQAIASPFAAGVLLLPPPYCFASLLIAYLFAEMWFGVLFAILIFDGSSRSVFLRYCRFALRYEQCKVNIIF
jgi:hypothetical protein